MPPISTVVVTMLNFEVISMFDIVFMAAPIDIVGGSVMFTCGRFVF